MLNIVVDCGSNDIRLGKSGQFKDVAGVNGSPISLMPGFPDLEDQMNQMGISQFRMHDTYGIGDLDNGADPSRSSNGNQLIPNVPADQSERAKTFITSFGNLRTLYPNAAIGMRNGNYDLAFKDANYAITDQYFSRILRNNPTMNPNGVQREILFRVGRSIDSGYDLPANFDIYVTLVATLVQRYSANLALSGIPRKIAYWEIWNEPDLTFFWNSNDPARYYDFYSKIAWKIKELDPSAKVGGAGVANGYNPGGAYIDGLLQFCQTNNVPLDFISWHYYGNITSDPQNIIDIADYIERKCEDYGFGAIESLCTEWNSSPFATKNIFTKVQSAQNAAYAASSLIYMQSCKVDCAYYYRGDGLSFGLFNDNPNPADTRYKSFCTYTAQAFAMYNQFKQTPTLLSTTDTKRSGISVLAGKSRSMINVLIANYRVDPSLSNGKEPPLNNIFYQQHYVDSGRSIAQITDDWSVENYFAGKATSSLYNNNVETQAAIVPQIPVGGTLKARDRDYSASSGGIKMTLQNLPYKVASITARRIVEGGDLSAMRAPVSTTHSFVNNGSTCTITDAGARESSVTLYSITLSNVAPPDPPAPTPTIGQRADFSSNGIFGYGISIMPRNQIPANFFMPLNSRYRLDIKASYMSIKRLKVSGRSANLNIYSYTTLGTGVRNASFYIQMLKSAYLSEIVSDFGGSYVITFEGHNGRPYRLEASLTYLFGGKV